MRRKRDRRDRPDERRPSEPATRARPARRGRPRRPRAGHRTDDEPGRARAPTAGRRTRASAAHARSRDRGEPDEHARGGPTRGARPASKPPTNAPGTAPRIMRAATLAIDGAPEEHGAVEVAEEQRRRRDGERLRAADEHRADQQEEEPTALPGQRGQRPPRQSPRSASASVMTRRDGLRPAINPIDSDDDSHHE